MLVASFAVACSSPSELPVSDPYAVDYAFVPFVGTAAPDVTTDRLCPGSDNPESLADKVFIECEVEGANEHNPAEQTELVVMAYNILRGFELDAQIALLRDNPAVPAPDIIFLSEADRGCWRTDYRNVSRELADALGHNFVFAVEFVELPRPIEGGESEACEHGNAVLSRYPLGNVQAVRHANNLSWYDSADEPRLGGRIMVTADVEVGHRVLHIGALHLESKVDLERSAAQAAEAASFGTSRPFGAIVGGDTNAPLYFIDIMSADKNSDPVASTMFASGYVDPHASLPSTERSTMSESGLVIDLFFAKPQFIRTTNPGICDRAVCGQLSDHLPVWTTVVFDDSVRP